MARVVHIALKVEDLEKATRFYEDVLASTTSRPGMRAAIPRAT
jgi:catechol 2,3-dioxygenase-like lactoylglutathione lyase family enzyme